MLVIYPTLHIWYTRMLPAIIAKLPSKSYLATNTILTSIILDQLFCSPFYNAIYFYGVNYLEYYNHQTALDNVSKTFIPVMMVDYSFWPFANIINFKYIPIQFRMLYVNILGIFWNTFLAYKNQKDKVKQV